MLIFDSFPNKSQAEAFCLAVQQAYNLATHTYDSQDEANDNDPFPLTLFPPIVHVERTFNDTEGVIARMVRQFGGTFAGT